VKFTQGGKFFFHFFDFFLNSREQQVSRPAPPIQGRFYRIYVTLPRKNFRNFSGAVSSIDRANSYRENSLGQPFVAVILAPSSVRFTPARIGRRFRVELRLESRQRGACLPG
jgi:hypothetical protein